jgi:serine/threonine protein kinase
MPVSRTGATPPPAAPHDTRTMPVSRTGATPPPAANEDFQPTGVLPPESRGKATPSGAVQPASSPSGSKPATKRFSEQGSSEVDLTGRTIAGYRIKKRLGAGGMGAVFLAEQLSLDRDVALKILPGNLAQDPDFLARFTREALTAAQLSHHNIIQVFDIGNDGEIHFISMEFVRGRDLGDMVRKDGKLQPEDAAGYVLQAARGLAYAHKNGIIHRDIKPDNLMLNDQGIVKVGDMGLAKQQNMAERAVGLDVEGAEDSLKAQAYSNLTGVSVAMGTPAYMAPEQGRDASTVDHRADQYSLGCTLYYMIAGKAPYSGKTTFEIISKHQSEPLIPVETIVRNVPKELSIIIEKMLAKRPEDRFSSMDEVVKALEGYLGIDSAPGVYTPREHHVAVLEKELQAFQSIGARKLRMLLPPLYEAGVLVGGLVIALAMHQSQISGGAFVFAGALGLAVLTPLFHFLLNGFLTKEYFYRRFKSLVFGTSLKGWALTAAGTLVGLLVLHLTGLLVPWLTVALLAAGVAAGWQFGFVRKLRAREQAHVDAVNEMLRQLRLRGVSEEAIQDFVCRFSGERWEEFFERLFGYEDMVAQRARSLALDKVRPRKRFRLWRDPIVRWMDEVEEARRRLRETRQLAKAEKGRLKATGVSEDEAEKRATEIANQVMDQGLLQATAIIKNKATRESIAEMNKLAMDLHKSSKPGKVMLAMRIARALTALLLVGGFLLPVLSRMGVSAVNGLAPFINWYYKMNANMGMHWFTMVAGLAMAVMVFSRRVVVPTLALLACWAFMVSALIQPLVPSPQFTPFTALLGAAGLTLVGAVYLILFRGRGGKF